MRPRTSSHLNFRRARTRLLSDIFPNTPVCVRSISTTSLNKVTFERLMRLGPPPLSPQALIESAELTRVELTERLERRINVQMSLPYLPASNPHTSEVMKIYTNAWAELSATPPITCDFLSSLEQNGQLVNQLEKMVEDEANIIPLFAKGFQECRRYLSEDQISSFLDKAIRDRLSIRLLAEQHLALSHPAAQGSDTLIGIVNTELDIRNSIDRSAAFVRDLCDGTYGHSPSWIVKGDLNAKGCFVGIHSKVFNNPSGLLTLLEFASSSSESTYILTEILKNAFRATAEYHLKLPGSLVIPPIEITLSISQPPLPPNLRQLPKMLSIRIRDYGGGICPRIIDNIFAYAFTTISQSDDYDEGLFGQADGLKSGLGRLAGLGYGLPMARLYARYFGGNLEMVNLHGMSGGVDAFLLVRLGPEKQVG
ncbi:hypothetical protein CROQUDRAFT_88383 [Cronartium quercuum f. sp. fusiforme G11]|uniref:Protein-serine/threonine kinase n=1 Tax=Cronartium quercuum f. sp. fusiforme G11 TaxID=708437 RepID=A0A9P6NQ19_9BASI|nr:hypothetical protein CROQUDRAFT_88383 [Cronartium quercuum f. sp. fusiforme G11]